MQRHEHSSSSQELGTVGHRVALLILLEEASLDLEQVLGCPLQILSASFLGAFDAESSAVFHNPDVVVSDGDVLAFDGVNEGSLLAVVEVIWLDKLLLVLLNDEAEILDLSICWSVGFRAVVSTLLRGHWFEVVDSWRFSYSGLWCHS